MGLAHIGHETSDGTKRKLSSHMKKLWLDGVLMGKPAWNKGLIGFMSGSKNGMWKGGITDYWHKVRNSIRYENWRWNVFSRDDFTCKWCGANSKYDGKTILNAHHSVEFAKLLKTMFEKHIFNLDNGTTLCDSCHNLTKK